MACLIGAAFSLGWAAGVAFDGMARGWFALAVGSSASGALFMLWQPKSPACFWIVCGLAVANGALLGALHATEANAFIRLLGLTAAFGVAARYFHAANGFYTERFARTVYVSFCVHTNPQPLQSRASRRK